MLSCLSFIWHHVFSLNHHDVSMMSFDNVEMHVWFLPEMIGTWSVNAGKRWQMVCIYLHHCPLLVVDTIYQGISGYTLAKMNMEAENQLFGKAKKQHLPTFPRPGCFWRKNPGVVWWGRPCFVEGGVARFPRGSTKWGDRTSSDDLIFGRFSHASFTWTFQTNLVICWCCLNYFDGPKVFGHSPIWEAFRWRVQSPTAEAKPKEGMHNHQNLGDDTCYVYCNFVPMVIFLDGSSMIDEVNLIPG